MKHNLKPLLLIAAGGIFLSLISLVIWLTVNNIHNGLIFGRVTDVATSTITIADRNQKLTDILVSPVTNIEQRDQVLKISEIKVGNFLQVTGLSDENGNITASSIRLMRSPKEFNSQ